jgi:hypothetical protein
MVIIIFLLYEVLFKEIKITFSLFMSAFMILLYYNFINAVYFFLNRANIIRLISLLNPSFKRAYIKSTLNYT